MADLVKRKRITSHAPRAWSPMEVETPMRHCPQQSGQGADSERGAGDGHSSLTPRGAALLSLSPTLFLTPHPLNEFPCSVWEAQ